MTDSNISEKDLGLILRELLIPQIIGNIKPQKIKQCFILGGQPGSGKSACAKEILQTNKNIIFINGDDLRPYHPNYYYYLTKNDIELSDLTQEVCNLWVEQLIKICIDTGLNFMVEGTMRKKEASLNTALLAKRANYKINLVILSTPYQLSLISLECRYYELKRQVYFARFTKKESHDEAFYNIENVLIELINFKLFKKIFIYQRFFNKFKEYSFKSNQIKDILQCFRDGRKRDLKTVEKKLMKVLSSKG